MTTDDSLLSRDLAHEHVSEPERGAVDLQLDGTFGGNLAVEEDGVIGDDGAVERDGPLRADHLDVERVPLADLFVLAFLAGEEGDLAGAAGWVVPEAAGAFFVVPDLHLGLAAQVDAAVAPLGDFP